MNLMSIETLFYGFYVSLEFRLVQNMISVLIVVCNIRNHRSEVRDGQLKAQVVPYLRCGPISGIAMCGPFRVSVSLVGRKFRI